MDNFDNKRILYLDLLRIFSIFAMMMLHVAASNWSTIPVETFEWQIFNFYDSLVRFCVPTFVMISGVFFLDENREYTIKKLLTKNILRIITAFVFWSACYVIYKYDITNIKIFYNAVVDFILGQYHLWFLFTLVGLYLMVPFLREIAKSKILMEYFLLLAFIFNCMAILFEKIPYLGNIIILLEEKANIFFILGYSGYFILGYYLSKYVIYRRLRNICYSLGVISIVVTIVGTSYLSLLKVEPIPTLYSYLFPTTCFVSIAIFIFFKEEISKTKILYTKKNSIIFLSQRCFGMYLVHDFVNILLFKVFDFTTISFNPIFSVPIISFFVFIISFLITCVIHKIPILNKYII